MTWKAAPAVTQLFKQVNALAPKRSKLADGIIGDAAHAARSSDHNPNSAGIVCAGDVTAVTTGTFGGHLAEALRHDKRTHYVIWNRRIAYYGLPFVRYFGTSPHTDHVHWSCRQSATYWNDARPFLLEPYFAGVKPVRDWWWVSFRTKKTGNAALVEKYARLTLGVKCKLEPRADGSVAFLAHTSLGAGVKLAAYALGKSIIAKVQRTDLSNDTANMQHVIDTE